MAYYMFLLFILQGTSQGNISHTHRYGSASNPHAIDLWHSTLTNVPLEHITLKNACNEECLTTGFVCVCVHSYIFGCVYQTLIYVISYNNINYE